MVEITLQEKFINVTDLINYKNTYIFVYCNCQQMHYRISFFICRNIVNHLLDQDPCREMLK